MMYNEELTLGESQSKGTPLLLGSSEIFFSDTRDLNAKVSKKGSFTKQTGLSLSNRFPFKEGIRSTWARTL